MDMSINQRLANFLYEKKISQEELRIKLGLKTRQQVSNWLNCRDHIPDKHLMGIIRLFPKTLLLKKEEEIEKKEKEMRESCRELGKMEERLSQFEKVLAQKECTH